MKRKPILPFVHRNGGYDYFRRPGFKRARLPGLPFSPEYMTAYQDAMAQMPVIGASRSKAGTVAAAVAAYLVSPEFTTGLSPGTQAMRRAILNRFRDQYGEHPIRQMPPKFIALVLGKMSAHAARNWFKCLRALCQFALANEIIAADPTAGLRLPKVKKAGGFHTWSEAEVAQYEAAHPVGSKARLALALGIYTLQRRSDVIRMGRQHIEAGEAFQVGGQVIDQWLRVKQQKTGTLVELPIFPALQAVIDATPSAHLTFLTSKSGRPYSGNDFSEQFRAWCDAAGLPKACVFHGLRKLGCTRLADAGCTTHEIAAWSGHLTLKEVETYTKAADRKRNARAALGKVLNASGTPSVQKPGFVQS
jgi:integrase